MMTSILAAIPLLFVYTNVPVADMREEPTKDSLMASQTFFSEPVEIIEEKDGWVKIETSVDKYQGWADKKILAFREGEYLAGPDTVVARVNRLTAHLYDREDTMYGPVLSLPFESFLEVIEPKGESDSRWIEVSLPDGRHLFIQRGDVSLEVRALTIDGMCSFSHTFLGLPYTYGGRSSLGYDCSGFTQMLYRQMGVLLPRDSKDQINWSGFTSVPVEEMQAGDLIFFGLAEDKIRHVGLCLDSKTFIHANAGEEKLKPFITVSEISHPSWNGSGGRFVYRAVRRLKTQN